VSVNRRPTSSSLNLKLLKKKLKNNIIKYPLGINQYPWGNYNGNKIIIVFINIARQRVKDT
jgi:hypothetical protein